MISLDCEATGLDIRHGAKPFLVTICNMEGANTWWEWEVNPYTRQPKIPKSDLGEVQEVLDSAEALVFQNPKFDVAGLVSIGIKWHEHYWKKVFDTLLAGHLLSSNSPHDLTSMVLVYLGINVQPHEERIKKAVNECQTLCRRDYPKWRIAKQGLFEMPSAKTKVWKNDMWLPRALVRKALANLDFSLLPPDVRQPSVGKVHKCTVAIDRNTKWGNPFVMGKHGDRKTVISKYVKWILNSELLQDLPELYGQVLGCHCAPKLCHGEVLKALCHPWFSACSEYANSDSTSTLYLFQKQKQLLQKKDLWNIYLERLKILSVVYKVEARGVTLNCKRLDKLAKEYRKETEIAGATCVRIAKQYGSELVLPKSGNNKSLLFCVFEAMKFPVVKTSSKTGKPSLDSKMVIPHYLDTEEGLKLEFMEALIAKRKRDTALGYMESYERFWLPLAKHTTVNGKNISPWRILYPSLNPTGTATLRWSSTNPNEQNISKKEGFNIRYCFGPAPGREWWALDYDNIELRIPGYECQEPAMLRLFEEPDIAPYFGSYHLLVFSILHPDKYDKRDSKGLLEAKENHPTIYGRVKAGNFAVQYGAVEKSGTADRAYGVEGAQAKVQKRFKRMADLNRKWIAFAKKYGYVETMPDRTVNPSKGYPLKCTRSKWGKVLETIPLNYHVQGTACWIISRAMVKVQEYFDELNATAGKEEYCMVMQVHDELVLDFPQKNNRGNLGKVSKVKTLMESIGPDIGVLLTCGIDYHPDNWSKKE